MRLASLPFLFLVIPGISFATASSAAAAPQVWKFNAGATPQVRVDNIAGTVRVQPSSDGAVAVEATKRGGDSEEQARLIVEAKSEGQGVQVRVCCGRCDGSGESCRGRVEVDVVVRAPAQSRLTVYGVSTDVFASGLTGDHDMNTVSGDVAVSGSRELRLKTVSGDVNVSGAAGLKLNTVSGDLKASDVRGDTQFHSVSGDVEWKGACGAGCRIEGDTHLRRRASRGCAVELIRAGVRVALGRLPGRRRDHDQQPGKTPDPGSRARGKG